MQNDKEIIICRNCQDIEMKKVKCGLSLWIDQCPNCGGIWLDKFELANLKELGDFYIKSLDTHPVIKGEQNRVRECPRCNIVLEPVLHKENQNLKIDRCNNCKGIWLDHGELLKLAKIMDDHK